jgi:hypothetical protein
VLAGDNGHVIARGQHLVQLYADTLELPEQLLVVSDELVDASVDARLGRVGIGVKLDVGVKENRRGTDLTQ